MSHNGSREPVLRLFCYESLLDLASRRPQLFDAVLSALL
jgi:hypothetical protein